MASEHKPLDEARIKRIEEIVQTYLKVPIRVKFTRYCYACGDCRKQPVMWTGEGVTHVDLATFDRLPPDYLAFMIGHEFGHARYTFPMDCSKANYYSADLLREAGMPVSEVRRLLQRWVGDALALENGQNPSWA